MRAVLALVLALGSACTARTSDAVTVCAAASLREVVTEVADGWSRSGGTRVEARFDSSDTLARQIRAGAPCDVFLSADPRWTLETEPIESFPWLGNRLVLVRRKGTTLADLAQATSLALGSEGSPVGRYAAAAMEAMGVAPPERTIRGSHVRDVLSKVAEGAAEAGIVYATDVPIDPRIEVASEIPSPDIVYPVALMTERGRGLYDAFRAPAAREIAKRHGFAEVR
ncbi:MAG: molybdate ABC transporter substrate-binding protein [Planctomycetota bacterium]